MLGIADLADRLDLTRSTTHRYASTLTQLGYLDQDKNRKYRLGLRVIDLGLTAVSQSGLLGIALGELQKLHHKTKLSVGLVVLNGLDIVYLQRLDSHAIAGRHDGSVWPLASGSRLPAHRTASGKVLLAHLSDEERVECVKRIEFERGGQGARKARTLFEAELDDIRDQGVGVNDEESSRGVIAIAAPVREDDEVIAAVSLVARQPDMTMRALLDQHAGVLLETAQEVSMALSQTK